MRSLQPNGSRTAQSHDRNPLGDGSLNARSRSLDLGKFLRLFLLSPVHQSLVLLPRTNRHGSACMANGLGTTRSRRTQLAVCCRELDLDHLVLPVVNSWCPTDAGVPFRTRCLLLLPVDEKVTGIEALFFPAERQTSLEQASFNGSQISSRVFAKTPLLPTGFFLLL